MKGDFADTNPMRLKKHFPGIVTPPLSTNSPVTHRSLTGKKLNMDVEAETKSEIIYFEDVEKKSTKTKKKSFFGTDNITDSPQSLPSNDVSPLSFKPRKKKTTSEVEEIKLPPETTEEEPVTPKKLKKKSSTTAVPTPSSDIHLPETLSPESKVVKKKKSTKITKDEIEQNLVSDIELNSPPKKVKSIKKKTVVEHENNDISIDNYVTEIPTPKSKKILKSKIPESIDEITLSPESVRDDSDVKPKRKSKKSTIESKTMDDADLIPEEKASKKIMKSKKLAASVDQVDAKNESFDSHENIAHGNRKSSIRDMWEKTIQENKEKEQTKKKTIRDLVIQDYSIATNLPTKDGTTDEKSIVKKRIGAWEQLFVQTAATPEQSEEQVHQAAIAAKNLNISDLVHSHDSEEYIEAEEFTIGDTHIYRIEQLHEHVAEYLRGAFSNSNAAHISLSCGIYSTSNLKPPLQAFAAAVRTTGSGSDGQSTIFVALTIKANPGFEHSFEVFGKKNVTIFSKDLNGNILERMVNLVPHSLDPKVLSRSDDSHQEYKSPVRTSPMAPSNNGGSVSYAAETKENDVKNHKKPGAKYQSLRPEDFDTSLTAESFYADRKHLKDRVSRTRKSFELRSPSLSPSSRNRERNTDEDYDLLYKNIVGEDAEYGLVSDSYTKDIFKQLRECVDVNQLLSTFAEIFSNRVTPANNLILIEVMSAVMLHTVSRFCEKSADVTTLGNDRSFLREIILIGSLHVSSIVVSEKLMFCVANLSIVIENRPKLASFGIHDMLVKIAQKFTQSAYIAKYAFLAAGNLCSGNLAVKGKLVNLGICRLLINSIELHGSSSKGIIRNAFFAIANLTDSPERRSQLLSLGLINHLFKYLDEYGPENSSIAYNGLRVLGNLAVTTEDIDRFVTMDGCELIFRLMQLHLHSDVSVAQYGLLAVGNVSSGSAEGRKQFFALGIKALILDIMNNNESNPILTRNCCFAIGNLICDQSSAHDEFADVPELMKIIITQILTYGNENGPLALYGILCIGNLACSNDAKVRLSELGVCELVINLMNSHGEYKASLAEHSLRSIANLSAIPDNIAVLGSKGAVDGTIKQLMVHSQNPAIARYGTLVISRLCLDDDNVLHLAKSDVCNVLLHTLQHFIAVTTFNNQIAYNVCNAFYHMTVTHGNKVIIDKLIALNARPLLKSLVLHNQSITELSAKPLAKKVAKILKTRRFFFF